MVWQSFALATRPDQKTLPIGLAPFERMPAHARAEQTSPPEGFIRSLAEWEEAEAVMTLWPNPSLVRALAKNGKVKLFADNATEKNWWEDWLVKNKIPPIDISYFVVKTDSIWIRDYGPWFILDGQGDFGIVDTKYNRPRPNDDLVPGYLSRALGYPLYQPGLVHTGGNYYNDGLSNAFSSTLVFRENSTLSKSEIESRMGDYLGITRYTTSKLAPKLTIEHIDTFGKLVSPDTWVFSEFPKNSVFRTDSENMVAEIAKLKSPFGTPYRILRAKMIPFGTKGEDYRAYLNSFISNRVLYYPSYGDEYDDEIAEIYQAALPGYKIVGVDALGTRWGDSVHCRNRNLLKKDTVFIFPSLTETPEANRSWELRVEIYHPAGNPLARPPRIFWSVDGKDQTPADLAPQEKRVYRAEFPALKSGAKVRLYVEVEDSTGVKKVSPPAAPMQTIDFTVR